MHLHAEGDKTDSDACGFFDNGQQQQHTDTHVVEQEAVSRAFPIPEIFNNNPNDGSNGFEEEQFDFAMRQYSDDIQ